MQLQWKLNGKRFCKNMIKFEDTSLNQRLSTALSGGRPYFIAEIGVNHEQDFGKACELIDLAAKAGADCVKFQTYKAETLAAKVSPAYWDTSKETTTSQFELFKKHDGFGRLEFERLHEHAQKNEVDFLSTCFDLTAVDFIDPLSPFHKIASADITNLPLLKRIAECRKPVVISTGASNLSEASFAISHLYANGAPIVIPCHCVLSYPTAAEDADLGMLPALENLTSHGKIGYSDHTVPGKHIEAVLIAALKGCVVIEKHFTDDKTKCGNDHYHAFDAQDLALFSDSLTQARTLLGKQVYKVPNASEGAARLHARRSLVLACEKTRGDTISEDDLICKRPGTGLCPTLLDHVIGRRVATDLSADHLLSWADLI